MHYNFSHECLWKYVPLKIPWGRRNIWNIVGSSITSHKVRKCCQFSFIFEEAFLTFELITWYFIIWTLLWVVLGFFGGFGFFFLCAVWTFNDLKKNISTLVYTRALENTISHSAVSPHDVLAGKLLVCLFLMLLVCLRWNRKLWAIKDPHNDASIIFS